MTFLLWDPYAIFWGWKDYGLGRRKLVYAGTVSHGCFFAVRFGFEERGRRVGGAEVGLWETGFVVL